uniref:A/G-specific adenine glycosylase n=2 Tax=Flavobacterium sp. TaxID=239 RepID=UPI00404B218B
MSFSNQLISWYLQNQRDLPWRNTTNPYEIWLSEIILQQTRVAQGTPYFEAFLNAFPTVFDLASASEQEVLKLWQGLGYYSRARNLHQTAQKVVNELNGQFPNSFKDLKSLKGVGDYTAAAIASFAFQEVVPVVDGNVFRVLSRYFGIETDILSSKAKKEFFELSETLIDNQKPDFYNQAIMEFGALFCVPQNPDCQVCIFNDSCFAFQKNKVKDLPLKIKKTKVKNRFLHYIILQDSQGYFRIRKRVEKGIWQNLYEFDLIESFQMESIEWVQSNFESELNETLVDFFQISNETILHKLTHRNLHISFYLAKIKAIKTDFLAIDSVISHPFPIVLFDFIQKNKEKLMI